MTHLDLRQQIVAVGLPEPECEYYFHPTRRWRFDYCWPEIKLALEVEGGVFARKGSKKCQACGLTPPGRHATGAGLRADIEKYNAATLLGWYVIRVMPEHIRSGEALMIVQQALTSVTRPFVPAPAQANLPLTRA